MTLADINWPLILAGLGLFLFGIDYMGDGLKSYAGDKLKDIIDKYTSSPVKGILIGALVTCLIQSSSGTTALTIGHEYYQSKIALDRAMQRLQTAAKYKR